MRNICSIDQCSEFAKGRGLCKKHYMALWRSEKSEHIKNYKKTYNKENAQSLKESESEYKKKNADKIKKQKKIYNEKNKIKVAATALAYRIANKEKRKEQGKAWREKNRDKWNIIQSSRYAKRKGAIGKYTPEEIQELYKKQKGCCAVCKIKLPKSYHKDHITPIASGGSNWISNIQLLCKHCNCSKHAKDPIEFMNQRGFLL